MFLSAIPRWLQLVQFISFNSAQWEYCLCCTKIMKQASSMHIRALINTCNLKLNRMSFSHSSCFIFRWGAHRVRRCNHCSNIYIVLSLHLFWNLRKQFNHIVSLHFYVVLINGPVIRLTFWTLLSNESIRFFQHLDFFVINTYLLLMLCSFRKKRLWGCMVWL